MMILAAPGRWLTRLAIGVTWLGLVSAPLRARVHAQQAASPRRVVVLYWYGKDYPGNVAFDQAFRPALQSAGTKVEYFPEYLESDRLPGENQERALRDYMQQKYADVVIDVVIASGINPLRFLLRNRDLFPEAPMVFVGSDLPSPAALTDGPGITGIVVYDAHRKNLELIEWLHPHTEHVFIISGTVERDRRVERAARKRLAGYRGRAQIGYLTDQSPEQLATTLKALPERSVILYVWQQYRTEQGRVLEASDYLKLIVQSAHAPVYGMSSAHVGNGIVGGHVFSTERNASRAAELALHLADGRSAQDTPPESGMTVPLFDWRQLQRWGIDQSLLPPGSVVQFKPPSFWSTYRWRIVGGIALFLLQGMLSVALLAQRSRRARAEELLRERQKQLQLLTEAIPQQVWTSLPDGTHDFRNRRWLEYSGLPDDGQSWLTIVHPDDRERALQACRAALADGTDIELELRLRAVDGSYRWFLSRSVPLRDATGNIVKWYGTNTDIEERRRMEEALRLKEEALRRSHARIQDLAGRLIAAQDEERNHIAHELHDDLNQQVAAVAINLSQLKRQLPETSESGHQQVARLQEGVNRLSAQMRHLSHQLHSSVLQHIGLAAALESHCNEFGAREGVSVALRINMTQPVPHSIAHCLYRVAQESLRNVAQHAGTQRAELALSVHDGVIELRVADQGAGCDPAQLDARRGLGLISIEERVRLVSGTFTLRSAPGAGTEVHVRVPLRLDHPRQFMGDRGITLSPINCRG